MIDSQTRCKSSKERHNHKQKSDRTADSNQVCVTAITLIIIIYTHVTNNITATIHKTADASTNLNPRTPRFISIFTTHMKYEYPCILQMMYLWILSGEKI